MKITVYKKFRFHFLALPRPHYWCRNRTTTSSLLSTAMVDTSNLEYACNVHVTHATYTMGLCFAPIRKE